MKNQFNKIDNGLAALASALIPGLGQAFESRWQKAMIFFFVSGVFYVIVLPAGIIFHIWSIFDAAFYGRKPGRAAPRPADSSLQKS